MLGCDSRHLGIKKLVLGALLLLNAFVWPKWLGIDGWVSFVALLMVVGGFVMLVSHPKSCCTPEAAPKKGKKKKR